MAIVQLTCVCLGFGNRPIVLHDRCAASYVCCSMQKSRYGRLWLLVLALCLLTFVTLAFVSASPIEKIAIIFSRSRHNQIFFFICIRSCALNAGAGIIPKQTAEELQVSANVRAAM